MNVLDLFSGIGGFSLGLERAGMRTVAFCENDIHCQKVLKKHWPNIPIFQDIKNITSAYIKSDIESNILKGIDVICGGFPCQDISVAGQKKGLKGERSGLWTEFKRIIKEVKPRYAIIENVANLRNMGLAEIIKDLWKIGYACEWHIISARSIGACHLRERIWIIAYPNSNAISQQPRRSSRKGGKDTIQPGNISQDGEITNTNELRLEGQRSLRSSRCPKKGRDRERDSLVNVYTDSEQVSNSNMPRLWQPFASEKEKSEWWAETSASFRDWWEIESRICRVDDGLSKKLERNRRERIKQLGNSVVPFIPEIIGRAIMEYEDTR